MEEELTLKQAAEIVTYKVKVEINWRLNDEW